MERMQAMAFVGAAPGGKPQAFRLWRASATMGELEATVARYLGAARARRAFEAFMRERGLDLSASDEADAHLIRHAEHLLSPAIGASTSRLVLSLLLRRRAMSGKSALKLLDDASAAIQSSRDQLQHALDHARQGITVFDSNLALTTWNREFADLFDLPPSMLQARRRPRRDRALQRLARRLRAGIVGRFRRRAHREPAQRRRAVALASLSLAAGDRDPLGAAARRRHRHDLYRRDADRSGGGGTRRGQRAAGAPRASAHRRTRAAQSGARAAPRPRRRKPMFPRRASSRRRATTFSSRSTRRGSMRVR